MAALDDRRTLAGPPAALELAELLCLGKGVLDRFGLSEEGAAAGPPAALPALWFRFLLFSPGTHFGLFGIVGGLPKTGTGSGCAMVPVSFFSTNS